MGNFNLIPMKRTFIALDIPLTEETKTFLLAMKKRFNTQGMKWVDFDNLHLTLQFIGPTSPGQERQIIAILQQTVPAFSVFELSLKGLGVFSWKRAPQVVWLGFQPQSELMALQQTLQHELNQVAMKNDERIFVPHCTFLRLKSGGKQNELMQFVREHAKRSFHSLLIQSVQFYASELTPRGAVYSRICSVSLH
jgi:2'-5' RNA ligase